MSYPLRRHRRLRHHEALRELIRETTCTVHDLIYPIFVIEGKQEKQAIPSMPGVYQLPLEQLEQEIHEVAQLGIRAVLIFGVPAHKDELGTQAYDDQGIVQQAIRRIKQIHPNLLVLADTCLCQFTSHGHCGVVSEESIINNDATLPLLVQAAVSQAHAGADMIAPSNMMDGFVQAIRSGLDEAGYHHIPIMSYAVKYASAFYGPFRDAAHSAPQFGDRRTYQMDPANVREALREIQSDIAEGADVLMVKPALAYMDVISAVREHSDLPVAAYNVSAEYAMVKAAAANGWIDEQAVVMETMTGLKRAGADMIITYHAKDIAHWLQVK